MKTKLVYVLTCAPEANYIEQALMSVWSARHWNPDAHIVLITDNLTDKLFVGKRAEILDYISEKIVVPFEDDSLSMVYRSRWLKTSVRQLIKGDFLFIDCDTIIMKSLLDIDKIPFDVGLVQDAHTKIEDDATGLYLPTIANCKKFDFDATSESEYYNSGVMFIRDTPQSYSLFDAWHQEWLRGTTMDFYGDEPPLMAVNKRLGYIIQEIPGEWNCQIFMNPLFIHQAYITHYWRVLGKLQSFMDIYAFRDYVAKNGLTDFVKQCVLTPLSTFLPGNNQLSILSLSEVYSLGTSYIHAILAFEKTVGVVEDFPWLRKMNKMERLCYYKGYYRLMIRLYFLRRFLSLRLKYKKSTIPQILCAN